MIFDSEATATPEDVLAGAGLGWPPPGSTEKFFLIKTSPLTNTISAEFQTKEELVQAATVAFDEAVSSKDVYAKFHIFVGHRIKVRGEPVRSLVFPDGTSVPLNPEVAPEEEEDFVLPPSARKT